MTPSEELADMCEEKERQYARAEAATKTLIDYTEASMRERADLQAQLLKAHEALKYTKDFIREAHYPMSVLFERIDETLAPYEPTPPPDEDLVESLKRQLWEEQEAHKRTASLQRVSGRTALENEGELEKARTRVAELEEVVKVVTEAHGAFAVDFYDPHPRMANPDVYRRVTDAAAQRLGEATYGPLRRALSAEHMKFPDFPDREDRIEALNERIRTLEAVVKSREEGCNNAERHRQEQFDRAERAEARLKIVEAGFEHDEGVIVRMAEVQDSAEARCKELERVAGLVGVTFGVSGEVLTVVNRYITRSEAFEAAFRYAQEHEYLEHAGDCQTHSACPCCPENYPCDCNADKKLLELVAHALTFPKEP